MNKIEKVLEGLANAKPRNGNTMRYLYGISDILELYNEYGDDNLSEEEALEMISIKVLECAE